MNKALNYLGIARKSGGMETGEDNSSGLVKAGKARVLIVASDTSEGAKRRAEGYVFETNTVLVEVPFTKDEISSISGKSGCSMAAITDLGLAAAFLKALAYENGEKYSDAYERIEALRQRIEKRKEGKTSPLRGSKTGIRRKKSV
ncbi:MAG: hypothetical protein E7420_04600 [Ruminococcaceae bacterium]|nr:hypothetical protein [Oscillospiraceae bacterium]